MRAITFTNYKNDRYRIEVLYTGIQRRERTRALRNLEIVISDYVNT